MHGTDQEVFILRSHWRIEIRKFSLFDIIKKLLILVSNVFKAHRNNFQFWFESQIGFCIWVHKPVWWSHRYRNWRLTWLLTCSRDAACAPTMDWELPSNKTWVSFSLKIFFTVADLCSYKKQQKEQVHPLCQFSAVVVWLIVQLGDPWCQGGNFCKVWCYVLACMLYVLFRFLKNYWVFSA